MSVDPDRELVVLSALSRGEIGHRDAVRALDMPYSDILQRMGELDLPLYALPDEVLAPMVENFVRLMKEAERCGDPEDSAGGPDVSDATPRQP